MENFKTRFDDFTLGKQVLLFNENPFLIRNVREFSAETQHIFPWASAASLQSELIDLQESLALKEADCDAPTFWTQMVTADEFPILHKMALHILTMFGSTYSCFTNEHLHVSPSGHHTFCAKILSLGIRPKVPLLPLNSVWQIVL